MSGAKLHPPSGMRDFSPAQMQLRRRLLDTIENVYRLYGFSPIDTPAMENLSVLLGKGGAENEKLLFRVMKRGEDLQRASGIADAADLALRFDLTVPLARYVATNADRITFPFRCYHVAPVWRADRPQRGRWREFFQCDLDVVGANHPWLHEVELLSAADEALKRLDIPPFAIRLSDRRLAALVAGAAGIPEDKKTNFYILLDKFGKKLDLENLSTAEAKAFEALARGDFQEPFLDKVRQELEEVIQAVRLLTERIRRFRPSLDIRFDPFLVRGLDYYTGFIFEIALADETFPLSIGGGGRYDDLIEKLGGPAKTRAVGLSLGFERLLLLLEEREKTPLPKEGWILALLPDEETFDRAAVDLEKIRSAGFAVEGMIQKKERGKRLQAAQAEGFQWAILDKEENGLLDIRRLADRREEKISLEAFLEILKGRSKTAGKFSGIEVKEEK